MLSDLHEVMSNGQHLANGPQSNSRATALTGGHSLGLLGEPAGRKQQGEGQISGSEERVKSD